jgi:ABC-2 type transport system ATP-binding protein
LTDPTDPISPEPDVVEPPSSSTPVLEIEGLSKRYGKVDVLGGLSLRVCEGEVYGFLGRNGAGKSTTIRIVMGITKSDGGAVRLFGETRGGDAVSLRQRIGYVAQEQNFYGWMTPQALGDFVGPFYPTWDAQEYTRLVKQLDLPPKRKLGTFSGGMKVKLGLCLALAHRPRLLVLDEPMAGLDPVARREFLEMVREQAEETGRTTFFSTHLIDEIELAAHRVGIIDAGRARYEGRVGDLAARVRRLVHPFVEGEPEPELPAALIETEGSFTVLQRRTRDQRRELVVQSDHPEQFPQLLAGGWALEPMALEEIFIDMVRKPLKAR